MQKDSNYSKQIINQIAGFFFECFDDIVCCFIDWSDLVGYKQLRLLVVQCWYKTASCIIVQAFYVYVILQL